MSDHFSLSGAKLEDPGSWAGESGGRGAPLAHPGWDLGWPGRGRSSRGAGRGDIRRDRRSLPPAAGSPLSSRAAGEIRMGSLSPQVGGAPTEAASGPGMCEGRDDGRSRRRAFCVTPSL